eukprot:gnl/TRDRNA2_/TRDRNA2_166822_c0_seq1.p1 gnl/TRDRNA2_/TRDRNA2_166822_c0~~gnl/TRDRNA2_/TRDRNA2_166822_c0_seq1.p1  ORF type:complete len:325 (+),score=78.91 gnl/TRDRNA2_/TRDRNA2_166822_c0_seq1:137-976(+)
MELLEDVERRGGEGLMLRRPGSVYEHRRSKTLLKVKTFFDEEAQVVGHEAGHGRCAGSCGALICKSPDGRSFKVGSGLSDEQRRNPPKVGSVITYRYQELTKANIPRFPTLVGERIDISWTAICASYVPPGPRLEAALKKKHSVLFDDGGVAASAVSSAASTAPASASGTAAGPSPPKRSLSKADAKQLGASEEDLEDLEGEDVAASEKAPPPKRPRVTDKRPICMYGTKCYRKNPAHFTEFAHPWLDTENEEEPPPPTASTEPPPAAFRCSPGALPAD